MNEASSRVRMDPRGVVANDPWRLVQTRYERERAARDETLFSLANGALGVRGGFEEVDSPTDGSFLAAAFEQNPIHYHERLPGFDALGTFFPGRGVGLPKSGKIGPPDRDEMGVMRGRRWPGGHCAR